MASKTIEIATTDATEKVVTAWIPEAELVETAAKMFSRGDRMKLEAVLLLAVDAFGTETVKGVEVLKGKPKSGETAKAVDELIAVCLGCSAVTVKLYRGIGNVYGIDAASWGEATVGSMLASVSALRKAADAKVQVGKRKVSLREVVAGGATEDKVRAMVKGKPETTSPSNGGSARGTMTKPTTEGVVTVLKAAIKTQVLVEALAELSDDELRDVAIAFKAVMTASK